MQQPIRPSRKSLGRLADVKLRFAIEARAVECAMNHYRRAGYDVTAVGAVESYDLCAIKGDEELHVEVKGSTGGVTDVELTVNEVRHARNARTDLVVVDQIRCERLPDESFETTGGRLRHWSAWEPDAADLSPTRYRYRLPR